MPNYVQYQPSKYESMFVPYDMGVIQKSLADKQQRNDAAVQGFGAQMAKLNEVETADPQHYNAVMQNLRQGFDQIYTKHNGDLSAGYNDAINFIQQSRSDPFWKLNEAKMKAIAQEDQLVSQFGADALNFKSARSQQLLNDQGQYNGIDTFTPEVQKKDNWDGSMLDNVKAHMTPTKTGKSVSGSPVPGLFTTTEYSGVKVNKEAAFEDYQKSSSYKQQLRTYTELGQYTPTGEKMSKTDAESLIKSQFEKIAKAHEYKLIDQNFQGIPNWSAGLGTPPPTPVVPPNATNKDGTVATTSVMYKDVDAAKKQISNNNKVVADVTANLGKYVPGLIVPETAWGTSPTKEQIATRQANLQASNKLVEKYKTDRAGLYATLRAQGYNESEQLFDTKMRSAVEALNDVKRIDDGMKEVATAAGSDWSKVRDLSTTDGRSDTERTKINKQLRDLGKITTETNSWAIEPAINSNGRPTTAEEDAQTEIVTQTLSLANLTGGADIRGYVYDADKKLQNTDPGDGTEGKPQSVADMLKKLQIGDGKTDNSSMNYKVSSRLTTTASDKGNDGKRQQTFIVTISDKNGIRAHLRIPMDAAAGNNRTLGILRNSPVNKMNAFVGTGIDYGATKFDMNTFDPTLLANMRTWPGYEDISNVEIDYNGTVNTPSNFRAIVHRIGKAPLIMSADQFITESAQALTAKRAAEFSANTGMNAYSSEQ